MGCAMLRDVTEQSVTALALFDFSHVKWYTKVDAIDHVGPEDPRDAISMKTRLRTPSTHQLSRRPPHRKKCRRTTNCFSGRHPSPGSTFTRGPCVSSNHTKRLVEGHLGSWRPQCALPLTPTHRRLFLKWCRSQRNWAAVEWKEVVFSDARERIQIQSQQ
ncbi:uncharacterized protein TNCV_1360671 [Trichonephila clavipes]|nr:uncharacterized protein TNCV_1360671 [Trichonephila clavipes]